MAVNKQKNSDEAIDWMIALQESPEDLDLRESFAEWLTASPENLSAYEEIERARTAIQATSREPSLQIEGGPISSNSVGSERFGKVRTSKVEVEGIQPAVTTSRWSTVAAGIAVMGVIGYIVLPILFLYFSADHLTGTGERRTIELSDGSQVILGAKSAIAIDYSNEVRTLRLLDGMAYFKVRKDPKRPFRVQFGASRIEAIGTAFEVRETSGGVAVSVAEGVVRIDRSLSKPNTKAGKLLSSGKQLHLRWQAADYPMTRPASPDRIAQWRKNRLVADNWRAEDVLDLLKRHYRGVIIGGNREMRSQRVTGVYDLERPIQSVRLLAATLGLKVREVSPFMLVVSAI